MSDDTNAASGGELEAAPVVSAPNLEGDSLSVDQAFEAYQKRINPTAESADTATADTELSAEDNADPETAPSEDATEAKPEDDLPPLEPPGSWTKDRKEQFNALPRDLQEYVVDRVQEQDRDFRTRQNEVANERNAVKAEREAAEQVRKQYEAKLPLLEKKLQTVGPFADIQSHEDLKNLQKNDPFRFQEYQLYVWEQQAEQTELREAQAREATERQTKWTAFVGEQNKLAAEYIPELADSKKSQELTTKAGDLLRSIGFTQEDLNGFTAGEKVSLFDHRIQRLLFNALKFTEVKAAPPKAIPKPVPAVQKPGVAPAKGSNANDVQALRNKLSGTGSVEDAFALYQAKQRRRA
jgi:hypothetical protein